jgi:hypothetical protein
MVGSGDSPADKIVGLTARAVLLHRLARQIDGFGSRLEGRRLARRPVRPPGWRHP